MRTIFISFFVLLIAAMLGAQNVACHSMNNEYRECRVGSSGVIRLVAEISEALCIEGVTWGTATEGVVWVTRGCQATFATGTTSDPRARGEFPRVCESQNGRREYCRASTNKPVAIGRLLSKNACIEGMTWGYDRANQTLWVTDGCRAEFILGPVVPRDPPDDLNALVICASKDGRRQECAADTSGGVLIARHLSDEPCHFGREWGWNAKGVWVAKGCGAEFATRGKPTARAIWCESENDDRVECPAETQFGVALARQVGPGECRLGATWGFDEAMVWVTKGCRAQFALGGYRLPPHAVPPSAARITCESTDGKLRECAADTMRGIGLIRQIGDSPCVLNRTWGYRRDAIWVTEGCRAEFAVAR